MSSQSRNKVESNEDSRRSPPNIADFEVKRNSTSINHSARPSLEDLVVTPDEIVFLPKDQKSCFFCIDNETLYQDSPGLYLYFVLIKQLMIVMLFISLVSITLIVSNYEGNYYKSNERIWKLDILSLGNILGVKLRENKTIEKEDIEKSYYRTWIPDLVCSLIFLICILMFYFYMKKVIKKKETDLRNDKISHKTLEVINPPEKSNSVLIESLEMSDIMECASKITVVKKFGKEFGLFMKLDKLNKKLARKEEYLMDYTKDKQGIKKEIKKLKKSISNIENSIERQRINTKYDEMEIHKIFIVFKTVKERNKRFGESKKKGCLRLLDHESRSKITLGDVSFKPIYKETHEPSDLIWEHLHYSRFSRIKRALLSLFVNLVLLTVSIVIIYCFKTFQSRLPSEKACREYDINDKGTSDMGTKRFCYCKGLSGMDALKNSDECSGYLSYLSRILMIRFFSSIIIIIMNMIQKFVIQKLSLFEKPKSRSHLQKLVFIKIFIVIFINTSILIYLINLKIPNISDHLKEGEFDDFDRDWYLKVGNSILLTMMMSSLLQILFELLKILYFYKKKFKWNKKYNPIPESKYPTFELASRTAHVMNNIFSCFLYSGGIPLLNFICLLNLTMIYTWDKYLIYTYFRKPDKWNTSIYFTSLILLPIAVVLHCCFSFYTYGSSSIFMIESEYYEYFSGGANKNLAERFGRPSGVSNLVVMIVSFILIIGLMLLHWRKKKPEEISESLEKSETIDEKFASSNYLDYDMASIPGYEGVINLYKELYN